MLRLAIQKSGRLSDDSVELIRDCGIHFNNTGRSKLRCVATNFPVEILYLRDDDIPSCVADGVADAGIVGQNIVVEKQRSVEVLERLGFGRCRLSIGVPNSTVYQGVSDLEGLHIATSYPNTLAQFLVDEKVNASIHQISGSVEIAPGIGLADAVCDLVSTGSTLISNGLKEVETVLRSEAVLIAHPTPPDETRAFLDAFRFRIKAVRKAQHFKYILFNVPNASIDRVVNMLPGMKSPTVMPLAIEGWSSVHSVIKEDDFWEIVEQLHAAGAEGILVTKVEKMIF